MLTTRRRHLLMRNRITVTSAVLMKHKSISENRLLLCEIAVNYSYLLHLEL